MFSRDPGFELLRSTAGSRFGYDIRFQAMLEKKRTASAASADCGGPKASGWSIRARISTPSTNLGAGREKYELASTTHTRPSPTAESSDHPGSLRSEERFSRNAESA